MGSYLLGLCNDLVHRHNYRSAAYSSRATTKCADSVLYDRCVAVDHQHIIQIDSQTISDDLSKTGFLTLTVWRRPSQNCHFACWLDPYCRRFPTAGRHCSRRTESTNLDIAGNTNANQLAFIARLLLLRTQFLVIDHLKGLVQGRIIIAAVIKEPGGGRERKFVRLGEIATAYIHRIKIQFLSHDMDNSFDDESSLGSTCATIGISRDFVCENSRQFHQNCGNFVRSGKH